MYRGYIKRQTILIEITTNKGIAIDIDIYYSGKELCEHLQNGEFYDLIFLDIEMPEFTGIDVSKMIRDNFHVWHRHCVDLC